jgi:hypothetical protein
VCGIGYEVDVGEGVVLSLVLEMKRRQDVSRQEHYLDVGDSLHTKSEIILPLNNLRHHALDVH